MVVASFCFVLFCFVYRQIFTYCLYLSGIQKKVCLPNVQPSTHKHTHTHTHTPSFGVIFTQMKLENSSSSLVLALSLLFAPMLPQIT
jgi:hypothetical protein